MTTKTTRTPSRSRPITVSRRLRAARLALIATTALTPFWLAASATAEGLPTGGQVVQGAAQIAQPSPSQLNVNQASQRAVINWDGFSVGQGNAVRFNQPNSDSAVLNRVTGGLGSRIDGSITANGHVYLVNPRGVVVGPTGRVEAQGFVASSLQIDDEDFMSGRLRFNGNGASAAVENHGAIMIGRGGMAALLGGKVENTGTIVAPLGRVGFGAGERATLDLSGDGFLQIAMPSGTEGETLIEQAGRVSADGGLIEMRAATARDAARRVVNLSGVTEARSVSGRDGRIVLGGGPGGTVRVSGTVSTAPGSSATLVDASPRPAERPNIEITGRDIELAGAKIDASGRGGGGSIRIGGEFRGGPGLPRARTVSIDADSSIDAAALGTGDGGEIAVWSDAETVFLGTIDARGANGGEGGFVEVSGAERLQFTGVARVGSGGTVLLDPTNFEICIPVECGAGGSIVAPQSILDGLEGGATFTLTTDVGGTESGRITVSSAIDAATDLQAQTGTLELIANEDILINAPILLPDGRLELTATQEIFPGVGVTAGDIDVDRFTLNGGTWIQSQVTPASFSANDFRLLSGTFLRAAGQGTALDPFEINDVYGLQGMASFGSVPTIPGNPDLLDAVWELGSNIDATGTAGWWDFGEGFDGFRPIGSATPFTGTLEGRGNTIDGLITRWDTNGAGMFSTTDGATINDLTLTNLVVAPTETMVGGLIGFAEVTDLTNVAVGGNVSTSNISFGGEGPTSITIGGVAGEFQAGSLENVSFDGTVSVTQFEDQTVRAGGIAGETSVGGTVFNLRTGLGDATAGAPQIITIDGDGDALVGGIFGEVTFTNGMANLSGNTTIDVTLVESDSILSNSNGGIGGLFGALPTGGSPVNFNLGQSTTDVTVVAEQFDEVTSFVDVGGIIGLTGNNNIIAETQHSVSVDVTTNGFVESNVGGFAGEVSSGGSVFATQFLPVSGTVDVTAELDTSVGGLHGVNFGSVFSQDAQMNINVTATEFFGGMESIVGGSVGTNFGTVDDSFTGGTINVGGLGQFAVGGVIGANGAVTVTSLEGGGLSSQTINVGTSANPVQTDSTEVGGAVGRNFGTITQSDVIGVDVNVFAQALDSSVEGNLAVAVGGFVGADVGSVNTAFVGGGVSVDSQDLASAVGGFTGLADGVSTSVADAVVDIDVTSNFETSTGGFVGLLRDTFMGNTITDARAGGDVSYRQEGAPPFMVLPGATAIGGFVGFNVDDTIQRASATGNVSSESDTIDVAVGGFAGRNEGRLEDVYATGIASSFGSIGDTGGERVGGLIGQHGTNEPGIGQVLRAISTGQTVASGTGPGSVEGGSIGFDINGLLTDVFWDTDTSGQAAGSSPSGTGLTTAELQDTLGFQSFATTFDFVNVWAPGSAVGGLYPQIYTIDPVVYAVPNEVTQVYGEVPPAVTGTFNGGPDLYVFGPSGDALQNEVVFADIVLPEGQDAGETLEEFAPGTAQSDLLTSYTVIYEPFVYTITPAPLEITTLDQEKTFGDSAFALDETEGTGWQITGGALIDGDSIDSIPLISEGEAVEAPVGTYPITVDGEPIGVGVTNYEISFIELGQLTVSEMIVIVDVLVETLDQRKIYGDDAFVLAETEGTGWEIVGDDPFVGEDGIDRIALSSPGTEVTATVGSYDIVAGEIFGTGLENYDIQINEVGQLFVDPREIDLTITTLDQSRIYGGPFDLDETEGVGWSQSGNPDFVNGDSLTGVSLISAGEAGTAIVGQYGISVGDLTGPGIENYIVTFANEGVLDVTPAPLTLTTLDQTGTYGNVITLDETEDLGWEVTTGALFNDDAVTSVTLDSEGEAPLAPVGTYEIVSGEIVGEGLSNYEITVLDEGALTVTPRPVEIVIAPDGQGKTYGDGDFAFDETEGAGWVLNDGTFVGDDGIDTVPLDSDGADVTATVGTFDIVQGGAPLGRGLSNYAISVVQGGSLGVDQAPLVITPDDQVKVQGDELIFVGDEFSQTGLANDDTITAIDLFSDGAAADASTGGSPFDIFGSNAQGEGLENYEIEFEVGALTVIPVLEPDPIDIVFPPLDPGLPSQGDATFGSGFSEAIQTAAEASTEASSTATSAQSIEVAETALSVIERASSELQAAVSACRESDQVVTDLLGCVSEALESYSATLDPANLDLPQELSGVSSAVLAARDGIDAAKARAERRLAGVTDPTARREIELDAIAEARTALQTAEAEVTKAIGLIRADDPELASVYREQAETVITALVSVETELQRAVGL